MNRTLSSELIASLAPRLPATLPPSSVRQPVHTVYGGANLFKAETPEKFGALALRALEQYAPNAASFQVSEGVYSRVVNKLRREPVEDYRIDFEDGYGNRSDDEEDGHSIAAANQVARAAREGKLPPGIGIRIKPLTGQLYQRSIRTLDLFLNRLLEQQPLPPGFLLTLPKISSRAQVEVLADLLDQLEPKLGIPPGAIGIELMVETPRALFTATGECALPGLVAAGRGRTVAAHLGAYDYTALFRLVDGATNRMPVAVHRGASLTTEQAVQNRASVHQAWSLHRHHVRRALENGFYQGWDLHPAQLPARYAAVYTFFLENLDDASTRLRGFMERSAQATLKAGLFDDAATGQGLLNFFLRALNCGALSQDEVRHHSGLTPEELRTGSFLEILRLRGIV
ncbi:MAG: phosphoenolpyruvate kinase, partial [Acidobacteria bacterium]|nr:phosphoenolpyruvate kinase [Acidobacteriota bacterium]